MPDILLNQVEARVLGALVEKDITTPDYYPLSLNALVNACNQKNNRDPVMNLDENAVRDALAGLQEMRLAGPAGGADSRVTKYEHRLQEVFNFTRGETALLCVLLLRGPQTPGELRTRAARLAPVNDVSEVEDAVEELMTRAEGPYIVKLARQPGRRESRYAQTFTGAITVGLAGDDDQVQEEAMAETRGMASRAASNEALLERIASLEAAVAELRNELETLRERRAGTHD